MLNIKNLHISYAIGNKTYNAVNGVTFALEEGTALGIAGESGCGKSTIAKAILGILPSNASVNGEITYNNENLLTLNRRQMDKIRGSHISMIFQDPSTALNPERKIKNQFYDILGRSSKREMDEHILLALLGAQLDNPERIMNSYPFELSGGMKQRVAIAAALLKSPEILIADEPTSALDAGVRIQIIEHLAQVQKEKGLTMLYISHNLAELAKICNEILIMKNGEVIEYGDTASIFSDPKESYTKSLLEAVAD